MRTRNPLQQIWHFRESGLLVPEGRASDFTESSSQSYLQIKKKAETVERLYTDNNIPLSPRCDLAQLIADAKDLSDSWLLNRVENYSWELLFRVAYFDRIADAILPLESVSDCAEYLAALVSGNLELLERKRSKAKDVLWDSSGEISSADAQV